MLAGSDKSGKALQGHGQIRTRCHNAYLVRGPHTQGHGQGSLLQLVIIHGHKIKIIVGEFAEAHARILGHPMVGISQGHPAQPAFGTADQAFTILRVHGLLFLRDQAKLATVIGSGDGNMAVHLIHKNHAGLSHQLQLFCGGPP